MKNDTAKLIDASRRFKFLNVLNFKFSIVVLIFAFCIFNSETARAARLFTTGFEENNFTETMWTSISSGITAVSDTVHAGSYAMRVGGLAAAPFVVRQFTSSSGADMQFYTRFYFRTNFTPNSDTLIVVGRDQGTETHFMGVSLVANTRKLLLSGVSGSATVSSAQALALDTWYRVEVSVLKNDSTGSVTVKLYEGDETTELETITNSGIDTLADSAREVQFVYGDRNFLTVGASSKYFFFDDIAINDTTSTFQNTWPGPGKVLLLKPDSDVSATWTKSGSAPAATNHGGVSEVPGTPDDAVTFNADSGTTNIERLGLSDLPDEAKFSSTLKVVDVYGRFQRDATAGTAIYKLWDHEGNATDGTSITLGTSYGINTTADHLAYDASFKTKANINNFNVGYKGNTGAGEKRITALWANVEYVDSPNRRIIQRPLYIGLSGGLVGHWTFDGPDMAGTTAIDRSGEGNNGTLTGGPARSIGKVGQGLSFDGVDDLINIAAAASINNLPAMTVGLWVKQTSLTTASCGNNQTIIRKGTNGSDSLGWTIDLIGANNRIDFVADFETTNLNRQSANGSGYFTVNEWTHLTLTWDGSTTATNAKIYKNGTEVSSYTATTNGAGARADDSSTALQIAAANGFCNNNAVYDDVRLYNRVLSPAEIKRLYNIGVPSKVNASPTHRLTNGLVGYWTFDGKDMSATSATDLSGNGNTGTLTNGPVREIGKIGQALSFDGSDDYVNIPDAANLRPNNGNWSVSLWIKPPNESQLAAVISKRENSGDFEQWGVYICADLISQGCATAGKRVGSFMRQSGSAERRTETNIGLVDGSWQHVVMVSDQASDRVWIYIDGDKPVTNVSSVGSWPTVDTTSPVQIAGNNGALFYRGLVDDVRLYNRVLSPDEVTQLYNMGR